MAIDIKISSEQTIKHKGKQYRPVAIRSPKQNERYISPSGNLCISGHGFSESVYIILEEVIPPYRTPTDDDARQRPMAEFWDGPQVPPNPTQGTLVAVVGGNWPFVIADERRVTSYRHCRIPNEGAAK